jgi:alpha,alpha-trehalose-phosphate synthase [UDP-forming]
VSFRYWQRTCIGYVVDPICSATQMAKCQFHLNLIFQGNNQPSRYRVKIPDEGPCMRLLSVRLIVSLILGIAVVSAGFSYYEVLGEKRGLRSDLEHRAEVHGESLVANVEQSWSGVTSGVASAEAKGPNSAPNNDLQRLVQRFGNREHLLGVAIYDRQGAVVAMTSDLTKTLNVRPPLVAQAVAENHGESSFVRLDGAPVHILVLPIRRQDEVLGGLAIVHDATYIRDQILLVWRRTFFHMLAQVFLIVLITLLIVRWSITGPIARAALWMHALRTGKISFRQEVPDLDMFRPLAREVATMAESLNHARNAAENEARLREAGESMWTADRLSVQLRTRLENGHLFVVSNREPYMHQRNGKAVEVIVPPSGLVTALEPVLNACDGTWIAHGSGNADSEVVDSADRLRVPPTDPRYSLRRVWLTKEEEEGYYYGFANEGLWPLCHIAHTRPLFRAADWQHYQDVNRKFTEAVLEEIKDVVNPVVLVQDYHFALLPRLLKEKRPDARVAIFWHIPWPNPEAFGICPWQRQLVDGLLGADLIGFHIQSHCNNFLQTVDRVVESRVDWEHFSALRQDHRTIVRPFPISVDFTDDDASNANNPGFNYLERSALLRSLGVEATFMGIGVDRVDYTKGILERFLAIERFLEKYPRYQGKFTFVQIGAPSRTHIKRYHDLLAEVEAEAERINWRFQSGKWKPIVFLKRQHSHQEIGPYYRAADLCLVTSLHDGMNLVAKEFLAARSDERGVLILSRFTGAARELRDALIVNPYDIDQTAEAIRTALEMEPEDKQMRVHRMRKTIREHNIYRWAGNLITELCEVRLDAPEDVQERSRANATVA